MNQLTQNKNWQARQFERDFFMARLKDYKAQRSSLKKSLRELDEEIKEVEYILMGKASGGNREIKLPSKPKSIIENESNKEN